MGYDILAEGYNFIDLLLDEPSKIKKSIMKATTDSDGVVQENRQN